jgi:hypothetical protein
MRLISFASLALAVFTLAASIALLKRREWARIAFIVLMLLTIVWNLGSLAMMRDMLQMFDGLSQGLTGVQAEQVESAKNMVVVMSWAMALVFSAFSAWIVKRLCDADIRSEFL